MIFVKAGREDSDGCEGRGAGVGTKARIEAKASSLTLHPLACHCVQLACILLQLYMCTYMYSII